MNCEYHGCQYQAKTSGEVWNLCGVHKMALDVLSRNGNALDLIEWLQIGRSPGQRKAAAAAMVAKGKTTAAVPIGEGGQQ